MSYWRDVHRQAWKDTLEAIRLDSGLNILRTLGVPAVTAAIVIAFSHAFDTAIRTLAVMGALALIGAVFYLTKLFAIPPALASTAQDEKTALLAKLATFEPVEEDAAIMEGVAYIAFGEWQRGHEAAMVGLEAVARILGDIERQALKGRVRIWGRSLPTARHTPIPAAYWEHQSVDLQSVFGQGATPRTTKNGANVHERYHEPMINRAEFEREWPTQN